MQVVHLDLWLAGCPLGPMIVLTGLKNPACGYSIVGLVGPRPFQRLASSALELWRCDHPCGLVVSSAWQADVCLQGMVPQHHAVTVP
jgi:hypothetical protein